MKRFILFISFSVVFLNSCFFDQLIKIPFFFSHFQQHQALNAEVTLMDFLEMHYWGDDLNDDDDEQDRQLPFKKPIDQLSHHIIIPTEKPSTEAPDLETPVTDEPILKQDNLPNPATDALFRPPRS